ncbi:MAG TPA: TadE/TadG family type IV pilus assembly protein [Noviherbaspirillum sp.]|uniref:TadE/TadG family type IV pilus assembly protein n=1 Tax=Noviherbaspirillum sp. TaxID=1926288 RepID=UPI002B477164|nr:TadE/TadG family type IV pilus assembly protein [Noviherbaspirillum sp.]HJV84029.1 TadE/TadG family type IV pilus assembly protein [Noviherbaspirillum sp.]
MFPFIAKRTSVRRQSGSAAVEFAILLIPLLLMTGVIVELGRAFWYYDALAKSTRDAARLLSITAPETFASSGIPSAAALVVNASRAAGIPADLGTDDVTVICYDSNYQQANCEDGNPPHYLRVDVSYTLTIGDLFPVIFPTGRLTPLPITLDPGTTMRRM